MRIISYLLCLFTILEGKLVPAPFITDPEPIQRAGYNFTYEYFDVRLFHDVYGIALVKPRGTDATLLIASDPDWCRLIYTKLVEDTRQEAEYLRAFGGFGTGNGQFFDPKGLCIDTAVYDGNSDEHAIYVADRGNSRIVKLKYLITQDTIVADGNLISSLSYPMDVACASKTGGGAYIVVVEKDVHRIRLYQRNEAGIITAIQTYGSQGSGPGEFFNPNGVAICLATDALGGYFIYVTDTGNRRVVCLRYKPTEGITWKAEHRTLQNAQFLSVTASQYYCVYVTDFTQNKVWVFSPGLVELLYTYGNSSSLNGPKDIYIDWDRIGLTERWTATTGIQYFEIIPEVRELYPVPDTFDATTDSVMINFTVYETKQFLTMTVADTTVFSNQEYSPNRYTVYWDGRCAGGMVAVPGQHEIEVYCETYLLAETLVTVDGTAVASSGAQGHWTPEGNPYVLVGNCSVPSNDSLVIDPDVLVMGHGTGAKITANGPIKTLTGLGDSVLFTSHRKISPWPDPDPTYPGMWGGITIKHEASQVHHSRFEFASTPINIEPYTAADTIKLTMPDMATASNAQLPEELTPHPFVSLRAGSYPLPQGGGGN